MASALNHAGIVAVYDVGRHEERPYVVMELIEGRPMTALLAESRLPLKEAIDLAAQIADALATAHAAGIIHRDLKPQNVMVTADGRAKVVDFGLSKLAPTQVSGTAETIQGEALTGDYAVLGTAGYMAPEQVMGLPADGRADQFALGSMLYEMLTGRRAFRRDTSVRRCRRSWRMTRRRFPPCAPTCRRASSRSSAAASRSGPSADTPRPAISHTTCVTCTNSSSSTADPARNPGARDRRHGDGSRRRRRWPCSPSWPAC